MRITLMVLRYLWASPASMVGVLLVMLVILSGGRARLHRGVWEAWGGWFGKRLARGMPFSGPVAAITFGHVVLGDCNESLCATRCHEREHVRQYERWGILFFPAYLLTGLWAWVKGGHPYLDNAFEADARKAELTDRSSV